MHCLQAHKLDAMEFFKKFAVSPDELPDTGRLCGSCAIVCTLLLCGPGGRGWGHPQRAARHRGFLYATVLSCLLWLVKLE